jgi:cob(I)alamin adenosyltransferase
MKCPGKKLSGCNELYTSFMKLYTKTGDEGKTSLFGGARVPKYNLRIEAYGTIDELNSHIGLIRDQGPGERHTEVLLEIQDRLFTLGSHLATQPGKKNIVLPSFSQADVELLEQEMDRMETGLPPMKHFVLPGGHTTVSFIHIARCVCRRAERLVVHLAVEEEVSPLVLQYLNRLSDYLFMLSRDMAQTLGAAEVPWHPRK